MKKKNIKLMIVILIIIAAIFAIQNPFRETAIIEEVRDDIPVGIKIGEMAPDFILNTPEGESVKLSDFRGKAVLVNFWASWCLPCEIEMPMFQKKLNEHDNFVVVAVNLQETKEVARIWIDERGFTFTILMDPKTDVKNAYQVRTQPVSYFIDKNGIIRERKYGPLTEEEFDEKFQKMIEV